jgi:hypothetical protein
MRHFRAAFMGAMLVALLIPVMGSAASANEDGPGEGRGQCRREPVNTIFGSRSADWLPGTNCDDVIWGLRGNDTLIGRDGNDVLLGGRGNDRLLGGDGEFDILRGGQGYDRCVADDIDLYFGCEVVIPAST